MKANLLLFPASNKVEQKSASQQGLSEILQLLNKVSSISDVPDLPTAEALESILAEVCKYSGWPIAHLYQKSSENPQIFVSTGIWHIAPLVDATAITLFKQQSEDTHFELEKGIIGVIAARGEARALEDVTVLPQFLRADAAKASSVRGFFGFPVFLDGNVIAVAEFFSRDPALLDPVQLEIMTYVSSQIARIFERRNLKRKREDLIVQFRSSVERSVQNLFNVAGELKGAAGHMNEKCTASRNACQKVELGTGHIRRANADLCDAMEQLKDAGKKTDEKASHVIMTVREVSDDMGTAMQNLEELKAVAEGIESIVNHVSEIAGQTRMLGLNAFIEAAHVGERGKGFAIVASEIKTLANESEVASHSIADQVSSIQRKVDQSVTSMTNVIERMKNLKDTAVQMTEVVEGHNSATDLIDRNVSNSRSSVSEITDDMKATNHTMGALADLSQNLHGLAGNLHQSTQTVADSSVEFLGLMQE